MTKQIALVGDPTTTGGKIITGHEGFFCLGYHVAVQGDKTTCPKCKSIGTIIEGATNWIVAGKPVAYDGCIIACGCTPIGSNRVIATKSHMFVDITNNKQQSKTSTILSSINETLANPTLAPLSNSSNNLEAITVTDTLANEKDLIRADTRRLLQCVDELCDKHLYHDDIKRAFKQDVKKFANNIVYQVDNSTLRYEQGAEIIKEEEDSLLEQSLQWIARGLSILGGVGLMMAGAAMCTTGVGCIVGAYIGVHGANSIQEGIFGGDGFLKSTYQEAAKRLGMSDSVGSLVYDMIDMGISVKGKLKLVPKIGELGEPVKKLWYYGRQDLVRYYKQMGKWALRAEIGSDLLSLYSVIDDIKNVFVYDKDNDVSSLIISEPETITNIGELIDHCQIVIVLTFDKNEDIPRHYYRCTRPNGEQYNIE